MVVVVAVLLTVFVVVAVLDDMLLLDDDCSAMVGVGLCRGVVFVLYVVWYLDRPRRGSDFCSDMGDRSEDVLD